MRRGEERRGGDRGAEGEGREVRVDVGGSMFMAAYSAGQAGEEFRRGHPIEEASQRQRERPPHAITVFGLAPGGREGREKMLPAGGSVV